MSATAATLAPKLADVATQADLEASEYRMTSALNGLTESQARIEGHLTDLFMPIGHVEDG